MSIFWKHRWLKINAALQGQNQNPPSNHNHPPNLETLTGIWGVFSDEASGQKPHKDSWRRQTKVETAKWMMATLHYHPSQVAAVVGGAKYNANCLREQWNCSQTWKSPHGVFLEALCASLASWKVLFPRVHRLPTASGTWTDHRQSVSIKSWFFRREAWCCLVVMVSHVRHCAES